MNCKNCNNPVRDDYSFCPKCGAKIIRNRLTLKNLWYDITERYFNLDNSFLRTFIHLFTKPETVIGLYVNGVRKRYLNPISYFGIGLMLSGILLFLIRWIFQEDLVMDVFNIGGNQEVFRKIYNTALDFQSFVFILLIPMLALPAWLLINSRKHNFTEHLVAFTYILSHYTIATFPISVLVLIVNPSSYTSYGIVNIMFMLIYGLYVLYRISDFRFGAFFMRSLVFILFFITEYILLSNLILLLLLFFGIVSIEDFKPK